MLCALLIAGLGAAGARAQGPAPEPRSVLLLLDASKSMNVDAGNGESRLDAAKAAVDALVKALPADAQVGLRVYGSRVAEASRRAGCRDTRLAVPVGPLDRSELTAQVDALQGRGRTPIGRSLRAAAADLPAGGKRSVILVSDGGDNCAPPDPCRAAEAVAQRGVKLNISVVGLQVNPRVRRQLRCIAHAGGGAYVDAGDADALKDELLAAIARAFRDYRPVGTPVRGGSASRQATPVGRGQYLDTMQAGEERWYAVQVKAGQRLLGAATAIPARTTTATAHFGIQLYDPSGRQISHSDDEVAPPTSANEVPGPLTLAVRTPAVNASGPRRPGVYRIHLTLDADAADAQWPVELAIEPLGATEQPAFVRPPGPLSTALGAKPVPAAPPGPARRPSPAPEAADTGPSDSAPALAGAGVAGLLAGLVGGGLALRRRGR